MNNNQNQSVYDVVISGAGPVGLFLACELALGKCSVLILEKAENPHSPLKRLPFGIRGLSAPTIEALYHRGLLDDLEIPKRLKNPHAGAVQGPRRQVGHFAGIPIHEGDIDTSQWAYRLPSSTETALISEMEELETVLARRATTDVLNAYFPGQTWWPPIWNGYEFYEKKNILAFWTQLDKQGYDHALAIAQDLKQKDTSFLLPETDLNDLGFILLGKKMKKQAIDIFKYNLTANPNSADAYEGLAEGYDDVGEKELALENFKRSVDLNPNNSYAADRIKKLEAK